MTSQKDKMTPGPWCVEDPMAPESLWVVQAGKETYEWFPIAACTMPDEEDHLFTGSEVIANARAIAALPDLVAALRCAIGNIEHMAAWISAQNAGYSFECLGEDMPGIKSALAKATGQPELG